MTVDNPEDDARRTGTYFTGINDRRRPEVRCATDEPARLSFLGSLNSSVDAWAIDASMSGVGLMLPVRISLGEWVKVEMKAAILFGEVRYCHQEPDGRFRPGIEIETTISRENPRDSQGRAHSGEWIRFEKALL